MTPETLKCEAIDRSTPGFRFFREHNHPANINVGLKACFVKKA